MQGIFGPLAAMPQQGQQLMPQAAAPPPTAGPVGGRLAQMWEAFKTDPNVRQAVLAASTQMMQSPPPGQNSFGVIGQGVQHGMNTLDALRQRDRSQNIDEERYAEQTGLKERQVGAQEEGVKLQGRALNTRVDENKKNRRFQSLLTMGSQEFQAEQADLDRRLRRDLANIATSREATQNTHPTAHLMRQRAEWEYQGDPVVWDQKAAEYNEATGKTVSGMDMALLEQSRIQEQKDLFQKVNSQFFAEEEFKQRGSYLDNMFNTPWGGDMFEESYGIPYAQFRQQVLGAQAPAGVTEKAPQPRPSVNQAPWPPGPMNPMGENRAQSPVMGNDFERASQMALSGVQRDVAGSNMKARLSKEGTDFYFILIDKDSGREVGRQKATPEELRTFMNPQGN